MPVFPAEQGKIRTMAGRTRHEQAERGNDPVTRSDMPIWQERIYAVLARNAVRAPDHLLMPPPRAVELGTKVEL